MLFAKEALGAEYEENLMRASRKPWPWPVYKAIQALIWLLEYLLQLLTPAPTRVLREPMKVYDGAVFMMIARCGVADELKNGPLTAGQIAQNLGLRKDDVYRSLRLLVNNGVFEALPGKPTLFRNNAVSATLREGHPTRMRYWAFVCHYWVRMLDPDTMQQYLRSADPDAASNTPLFERSFGHPFWKHLQDTPGLDAAFSAAMSDQTHGLHGGLAILADYQWSKYSRMIDVGGGPGTVLEAVLRTHPHMQGVLFDQPQVVEDTVKLWKGKADSQSLMPRVAFVGGDFFKPESVPDGKDGDVYHLRHICHDWPDDAAVNLLQSLRTAIGPSKSKLVLTELVMRHEFGGSPTERMTASYDVVMNMLFHGKERTLEAWRALLDRGGFRFMHLREIRNSFTCIIECEPK